MCKKCKELAELNNDYDSLYIVESAKKIIKYFSKYGQSNLGEIVDGIFLFENLISILKHSVKDDYDEIISYIHKKFYNIAVIKNSVAEHIVKYFVNDSYIEAIQKYHFNSKYVINNEFDSNKSYYKDKKLICYPTFIGNNVHNIIKNLKKNRYCI